MVKASKKRVMLSLTKQSIKELEFLCEVYDMSKSQVVQMMTVVFHKSTLERMK